MSRLDDYNASKNDIKKRYAHYEEVKISKSINEIGKQK